MSPALIVKVAKKPKYIKGAFIVEAAFFGC